MEIRNSKIVQMTEADLLQVIESAKDANAKELNCIRVGIVQSFRVEDCTALVQIAAKRVMGYNFDGTQKLKDYAPIRAKVCFCSPYITHPPKQGDEVLLLFNDREIETWFINGQSNQQNHERMHDLTDCFAIFGIRSIPKMIQIVTDALHLFYGNSDVQLKESAINVNTTNLNVTATSKFVGNASIVGTTDSTILKDNTAATGTFLSADGKTISIVNGIVRNIS